MPGFDRTGPRGTGAMTGGGRGLCGRSGSVGDGYGGGFGYGRGRGRGGRGFGGGARFGWGGADVAPVPSPVVPEPRVDALAALRAEADMARDRLAAIERRIATMETADGE